MLNRKNFIMSETAIPELNKLNLNKEHKREWITQQASVNDGLESIDESPVVDSCEDSCSYGTDTELEEEVSTLSLGTPHIDSSNMTSIQDTLRNFMNSIGSIQTVGNVNISNSTNVHIGNLTNINGNIQIFTENVRANKRTARRNMRKGRRKSCTVTVDSFSSDDSVEGALQKENECEERVNSEAFLRQNKFKLPNDVDYIVQRNSWLAQCPMDKYLYLKEPVEYVIILHTATEKSEKRAKNIGFVRDVQMFHIETRGWNDIAYNFLIGCDGSAYEGRGWGVVGAHTLGYNRKSIGISFIGCFMIDLPPKSALNRCKRLLEYGVKNGHLHPNYKLLCHCQCSSTESPGRTLYEEIQTWDHFYNIENEEQ